MENNELTSKQIKNILEAALLASDHPLNIDHCMKLFEGDLYVPERTLIKTCIEELQAECDERGVELIKVASGFRYQTRVDIQTWVARLHAEKTPRYSRALMETLALVVYKQPITRAEIEDVRGVSVSSNIMKVLQEREWVKIVGHKEVPGRPAMFATTKKFLDYFNLQSLSELPSLADIKEFDQIAPELDFGQELPLVADQETDLDTESEFEPESRKESSQENEQHLDHSDEEYNDDVNLASQDEAHAITQTLSDDDLSEDNSEDSSEDQLEENVAEQQASNELDELDPHTEIKH